MLLLSYLAICSGDYSATRQNCQGATRRQSVSIAHGCDSTPAFIPAMADGHDDDGCRDRPCTPGETAAINYLIASGATAITVTDTGKISTNAKITGTLAARWWTDAKTTIRIAGTARKLAGPDPDVAAATAAVARSAASLRATLTDDATAVSRASSAVVKLDAYMNSLRGTGVLKEFNRAYKRRRTEAAANGQGFMTYAVAEARLRRALIPLLVGGKQANAQSLFAEIFER
jgi:hypothetical protein